MLKALRGRLAAIVSGPALPPPVLPLTRFHPDPPPHPPPHTTDADAATGADAGAGTDADAGAGADADAGEGLLTAKDWVVVTDKAISGASTGMVSYTADNGAALAGVIDTTPAAGYDRSGFASLRTVPGAPFPSLEYYDAFEIVFKPDSGGRVWQFNVGCESVVPDDLYQTLLPTAGSGPQDGSVSAAAWTVVRVPFDALVMTWRGFVQVEQLTLDARNITSLGFTMADGDSGPYDLAVKEIRAVRVADLEEPGSHHLD